ncbi:alpha/beta hydrolase [Sulfitobacter sp.]|uniref:alpha/beta hydrolase n=1 Tax=Sulfitobacter sp. TaxID=1903071 RepID=UPI003EF47DB4
MANEWHVKWLNEGVQRWNKRRKKVTFAPDLSGLNLFEALPPDFRDAPKTSMYFEKIDLSNADLTGADLSGSNFAKANFANANLSEAKLTLSNFTGANFSNANLSNVDASASKFDNARFENSILTGANFEGADANGAIFISSPILNDQISSMKSNNIKVFTSRSTYRETFKALRSQSQMNDFSKAYTVEDSRTPKNRYDVFFGTNRKPIVEQGAITGFSYSRDTILNYGVCEVIVPEERKVGSLSPNYSLGTRLWRKLLNKNDDGLRIDQLISLNEELFFLHLKSTAKKMKIKERPTIFVHGFNNSFDFAVRRAAQIGYDLRLGQGIGLFSWPSKGKGDPRSYSADEASAEASKYYLADFIEKFVDNAAHKEVNIIAHSMGCRCLMGALEQLSIHRQSALRGINQIILAAADVDAGIMPHLGKHAVINSKRTTSYVSDKDSALKVSGWLHDFPRVGLTPPTFLLTGMDTILVNNDDLGGFSHGYISSSRDVLSDINSLLKHDSSPDERFAVETVNIDAGQFWRIRD